MEDNRLIKKCQSGDKEAFQELISRYHPYVYKFLIKMTGNEDVSEDITQETFIKLIRNIDKFDIYGKAKFSTYIITLCKNCYIDYFRKNNKYINDIYINETLNIEYDNVEEKVLDRIQYEDINTSFEKLPEDQRIVIKMKYIEGLTLKEIGEKLEIEPKTIKSRIHNGVVKLRKLFEGGD